MFNEQDLSLIHILQYTYNWKDKIILMGGIRADHSDIYGTFVTPRAHSKYAPDDWVNLRVSVGKGQMCIRDSHCRFCHYCHRQLLLQFSGRHSD